MQKFLKLLNLLLYFPVYEYAYRSLLRTQWLPREKLLALQHEKLKKLLKYACQRVPYYQKVFREKNLSPQSIASISDLSKLPVLTKDLINQNFDELIALNYPKRKLLSYSTGGSTGQPTKFLHDANEMAWTEASVHRTYKWAGYKRGDKFLLISGLPDEKSTIISLLRRLQGQRRVSLFGADDQGVARAVDHFLSLNPRGIKGYSSWLNLMATDLRKREIKRQYKLRYVISSSEKLLPEARLNIKQGFGKDPFENYSSREFMIAAECEEHNGLHIASENVIVEVVKDGKPVTPGEWGEILITDLNRYGMPLIRYEIGDVGILSDRVCPCGRGLPMLEEVVGRVSDIIKTPDGKYIAAPAIAHIFKDLPVTKFRVIQETEDELLIKVVKGEGYSDRDERAIRKAFQNIRIVIRYVPDIETVGSGKNIIVQSKIKYF